MSETKSGPKAKTKASEPKEKPAPAPAETKSEAKSEAKPDAKPDAPKAEAPKNYHRGEGQKPVTQAYKDNWNAIFGKSKKKR
jgi:hypothetical protein